GGRMVVRSVRFAIPLLGSLVVGAVAGGCSAPTSDADRFREAIPNQEEVALRVPGAETANTGNVGKQTLRIADLASGDGTARYYRFSRDLTNVVDFGTAVILGSVWAIVHTEPTTVDAKTAVWGPGAASALEPAVWKFT